MKKSMTLLCLSLCILILAGCGKAEQPSAPDPAEGEGMSGQNNAGQNGEGAASQGDGSKGADADRLSEEDQVIERFRIVDGAESGNLVLAAEEGAEVYTFSPGEIPISVDGREADAPALEDGMIVDIAFDGTVMETFPAQFGRVYSVNAYGSGTKENPGGGYYDLCGLYLQVLNDLWDRDSGLNDGISMVSVDLSQAPGDLTEGEKMAIAWIFACQHNVGMLTMSHEELAEEGYLTEVSSNGDYKVYQWEDGVLFSITPVEQAENEVYSLPVLKFNAAKWRSPRGAYFFENCTVLWPEMGTWSGYEIGDEAIS